MALEHIHMLGRAYINKPPLTPEDGDKWLLDLVEAIAMVRLMGPFSIKCDEPGNEGVTGIIGLTTSHSSFHCWPDAERPFLTFDVYSCREFEPQAVLDCLARFEPTEIHYTVYDRSGENKEIARDTVVYER